MLACTMKIVVVNELRYLTSRHRGRVQSRMAGVLYRPVTGMTEPHDTRFHVSKCHVISETKLEESFFKGVMERDMEDVKQRGTERTLVI
jgi:hypothetical protein